MKNLKFIFILPFCRCGSHNVRVSSAKGKLPKTTFSVLSKNANERMDNVVMISGYDKGKYVWRVDCVEEGTGKVKKGDVWKFTVV